MTAEEIDAHLDYISGALLSLYRKLNWLHTL